ncbi:hypothetical protein [Modestobacter sp. VKM Ac-2985]|uniref:hypothetical protein n=1 Tax=Modestobacter sp. VKM Ac-2985 TaxID=3004139 RepID=UPI0022AB7B2F|nr:hypothetical protein [Modestobacter sp. VKM Ac-2985]MCZ2836771.1 hypothetical protein [Modestobacter sp. VKM Ac-2985]
MTVQHLVTGQDARYFWTTEIGRLLEEADKHTKLILFGVTYYDLEDHLASEALAELDRAYGELEIWSHRWPDGYSRPSRNVNIPPQDIVYGPLGYELTPPEKRLLRLSLVAARAVPTEGRDDDVALVSALTQWLEVDPTNWDRLVREPDLAALLAEARAAHTRASRVADATVIEEHTDFIDLNIAGRHVSHEIAIIDDVLADRRAAKNTVVVAWLGTDRVLLCRRDPQQELPSLRWLIDNRLQGAVPVALRGEAYGPQDSVYFRLTDVGVKSALRPEMRELAKQLAAASTGGRYLTAAVARDVAGIANRVFRSIDLTGQFTRSHDPQIEVVAADLYDLIHTSSRTGERRHTLTMPIRVYGPAAIAFLYMDGGYNSDKAERLLEGAMVGLSGRGVAWLGLPPQSGRLRLDIRPILQADEDIAAVREALRAPRIKSIASEGLVATDSVIGKVLSNVRLDRLVTIADSETIGPSVAHALTLLAAGAALREGAAKASILDLFAGSGVANRLLSNAGFDVTSVDLYVSASSVGLDFSSSPSLWLRADARAVVHQSHPLIEQQFDVIGLDPPHSELVELLFGAEQGESLVRLCARRSDLLVLYQGHSTQRGRLDLVMNGLAEAGWCHRSILLVEEELIVVATTERTKADDFQLLVQRIVDDVQVWFIRHQMPDVHAVELAIGHDPVGKFELA